MVMIKCQKVVFWPFLLAFGLIIFYVYDIVGNISSVIEDF